MAIRIFTDSTSDILPTDAEKMGVTTTPLKVSFGSEQYIDKVTITNKEFYEKLATSTQTPMTTLVSPTEFIDAFSKYPDDDIIGIFISSKLSGTYNSAVLAKNELGRSNITLIDSQTVTAGLSLLVEIACKLRDEGRDFEYIARHIEQLTYKVEICAYIDTLKYLVKGGRLSGAQGVIGGMLNIKPIVHVKHGVVNTIGKERGTKKAMKFLIDFINNNMDRSQPAMLAYTTDTEAVTSLRGELGLPANTALTAIGSVVGTHAGPGAVGLAYIKA